MQRQKGTRGRVRPWFASLGQGGRRMRRLLIAAAAGLTLVAGPLTTPALARPDQADAVEVYERDVFEIVGSTLRNPDAATDPQAPLFTNTGVALGTTWGAWSAASAGSTARTNGARTDVRLSLTGLIPGGLYSVFWGTLQPDSEHPGCPDVERTLPLDAARPDAGAGPNAFVVGAGGTVEYRGQAGARLLDAGQVFFTVVYHFSGRTAYPFPNLGEQQTQGENCRSSFGEDAMRHLVILQKW
jgi:hypothetical protein